MGGNIGNVATFNEKDDTSIPRQHTIRPELAHFKQCPQQIDAVKQTCQPASVDDR